MNKNLQVFLVHPGGPFFKFNDRVWGIPKGSPACNTLRSNAGRQENEEDLLETAKREFCEETSFPGAALANVNFINLGFVTQKNGKTVHCWAFESDLPTNFVFTSNLTKFGWPENDKGEFLEIETAKQKIFPPQKLFVDRLQEIV